MEFLNFISKFCCSSFSVSLWPSSLLFFSLLTMSDEHALPPTNDQIRGKKDLRIPGSRPESVQFRARVRGPIPLVITEQTLPSSYTALEMKWESDIDEWKEGRKRERLPNSLSVCPSVDRYLTVLPGWRKNCAFHCFVTLSVITRKGSFVEALENCKGPVGRRSRSLDCSLSIQSRTYASGVIVSLVRMVYTVDAVKECNSTHGSLSHLFGARELLTNGSQCQICIFLLFSLSLSRSHTRSLWTINYC